jgi:alcohol dehydrogenase class IV
MALITYLTRIQFDHGALALLADEMKAIGIKRPLIVTDPGLAKTPIIDLVKDAMGRPNDLAVFDRTPGNPTEAATLEALEMYKARGCDGVVAVGGGSSMDLAKGVRLLATHDGALAHYAMVEGGVARIRADVAPMIAIPTTAGTGSEVGRGAVIVLADGRKLALVSPHLIPNLALCDPDLTLGLPKHLTAGTGMDAVAHCIETFCAPSINPPAEAIALDGLGKAARHLDRAIADPFDKEARWNMMMASMEGAMAFQKGLGAVHALSHPLGALTEVSLHHGTLNAVLMPAVLRFNRSVLGDKWGKLAEVIGVPAGQDLAEFVAEWNSRSGIPTGLRTMGVTDAMLAKIAEAAMKDHCHATNPRKATVGDYLSILAVSMG